MHDRTAGWLGGFGIGVTLTLLFGNDGLMSRTAFRDRLTRYGRNIRDRARSHADEKGGANAWLVGVAGVGVGLLAYGLLRMADRGEQFADVTRSLEEFVDGELSPEEDRTPGEHANQYINAGEDPNFEFSGDSSATQFSGIASGIAPDAGAAPEEKKVEIPAGLTRNKNSGAGTAEDEASGTV